MSDATNTRFRLTADRLPNNHEDEFAMYKFLKSEPKHITPATGGNLRLNGVTITEVQGNTARKIMERDGMTDIGQVVRMLLDQAADAE